MLVASKIKEYPDGTKKLYVYNEPYFVGRSESSNRGANKQSELSKEEKEHNEYMNMIRLRNKLKDYILSNEFDTFWTLTFNSERENDERCFNRLSNWLKYMKRKYGLFRYIFIPERHKDGCIHFHAVLGGFKGKLKDSGVKFKGQTVYNAIDWKYGFTTITKIKDNKKVSSYITKYITKELTQEIVGKGKKKYWSSRGLKLPVEKQLDYIPEVNKKPNWENKNIKIYNL